MKLVVILASVFMVACASKNVNHLGDSKSYILFPKENINKSSSVWARRYSIELKGSETEHSIELLNGADEFVVVKGLPEGIYNFESVSWKLARRWRSAANQLHQIPIDVDVCSKPNTVSIFPLEFNISQEGTGRRFTSYFDYSAVNEEKFQSLKEGFCAENDCAGLEFEYGLCDKDMKNMSI